MKRWIAFLVLALFSNTAFSQSVLLLEVSEGKYVGIVTMSDGQQFALPTANITVKKLKVVPVEPTPVEKKVSQVTYVYEKDNGNIPRPVLFALNKLNVDSG